MVSRRPSPRSNRLKRQDIEAGEFGQIVERQTSLKARPANISAQARERIVACTIRHPAQMSVTPGGERVRR